MQNNKNMNRCIICFNPSSRPNVSIDIKGVCSVCKLVKKNRHTAKNNPTRKKEILSIKEWGKKNTKSVYDCIVTVSGGKDSIRQAFYVRDELKMKPLLVSSQYPPEQVSERGVQNLSTLINHGFDCISISVNPVAFKKLMRESFFKYGNIFTAAEMALYGMPIHVAIAEHVPLVFLGENPVATIGEKHGRLDGDASKMRKSNTIKDGSKVFLNQTINKKNLHFYTYPPERDIKHAKIRIIYLGYYIPDWSGWNNGQFSLKKGLIKRQDTPANTGDLWGLSALDDDFRIVNQYLKYLKYGFGHVTDQVMERIHAKKMTKSRASYLINKYDGKCHPKYIKKFCDYIEIDEKMFWSVAEKIKNKELHEK